MGRRLKISAIAIAVLLGFSLSARSAEVQPLAGLDLFGGAERGTGGEKPVGEASGIGGAQFLGVLPIAGPFGLQGSTGILGGNDYLRVGVSAGPVYAYSKGRFGLFVDYEFKHTALAHVAPGLRPFQDRDGTNNNFIYIRGVWAHYFDSFDLVLSYSQPVNDIQYSSALHLKSPNKAIPCVPEKDLTINELKAFIRYYPTPDWELNAGMLVNSFAGPDRNKTGTGVGGVFGASYRLFGPVVLNLFQGQMDSRSRYRVTSGIQFFWSPGSLQEEKRKISELAQANVGLGGGASSAGA